MAERPYDPGATGIDSTNVADAANAENYLGDPMVISAMLRTFLGQYFALAERQAAEPGDEIDIEAEIGKLITPLSAVLRGADTAAATPMRGWNSEGGLADAVRRRLGIEGTDDEMMQVILWQLIEAVSDVGAAFDRGEDWKAIVDAAVEGFSFFIAGVLPMTTKSF